MVKTIQGKKKHTKIGPIKDEQNNIITDDFGKTKSFNSFFTSVGSKLASDIIPVEGFKNLEHFHRIIPTISTISVDTEKIRTSIKRVAKPGYGYGANNITSTEINLVGNFASDGLRHVIEKSINKSKYTNMWKISKVKTIFKKGSQLDRGNYRPISLLSIQGKVLENIIEDEIDRHFLQNPWIYNEHQWGFKKGRSLELLMLHLTETWKEALDQGKLSEYYL